MECMGVASGCGEQESGVACGSGWNLWVWLLSVVVRRYIDFLIPYSCMFFFAAASLLFVQFIIESVDSIIIESVDSISGIAIDEIHYKRLTSSR